LLGELLTADGGDYRGPRLACGQGHPAEFLDYRAQEGLTVLAPVTVQRGYSHWAAGHAGLLPKDRALDLGETSFPPGGRWRLLGRVGAREPFAAGRRDLAEWAGVAAETQAVERVAEASGAQLATRSQREQARTLAGQGKVGPLQPRPQRYIAREGTGVPMVPPEPTGRPGQDATGQATTREAKLGCVFPQTGVEETGRPGRDENSTTYGGALEAAEAFGPRLYAEAVRRGVTRAAQVLVLGDGAPSGSGGSPPNTSTGPLRSSISPPLGNTGPIGASASTAPPTQRRWRGQRRAARNSTPGLSGP